MKHQTSNPKHRPSMFDAWTFKMAWRDSRGSRRRFVLFLSSMVLGVAALVAISAFGDNLRRAIDEEAKTLLGADFSLEANQPFSPETEALIDSLGGRQSRRVTFPSMALFPKTGDTRLATVRAIEGDYPFYGAVETAPAEAARTYLDGADALVDGTLMTQFGVQVGDSVEIGRRSYRVAGELVKTPREASAAALFSPRIYIPRAQLDTTLLATGSRADYEVYFQFEDGRDAEALADDLEPTLRERRVGF
ncbi:MAG: ABC transporter permease, partial [Rhodothermales bacterium]